MDLEQHGPGQSQHRGVVGEDAHDVGAPLHLFVEPFQRVGAPQLAPVRDREGGEGDQVLAGSVSILATAGNFGASMAATLSTWSVTSAAVGWAKMVRIAAATISAEPLGTRASTLRRKWTRQRCQPAPAMTAPMACLRPVWASEMTSCTPASPRAFRLRRNAVQKAPSSLSPTSSPRTSRPPSVVTPVAMTTARLTTRPFTRALR